MVVVAIFGGTFNPPHIGHKKIVEKLNELSFVDEILVIPTKTPPHKEFKELACEKDRLEMCKLMINNIPKASTSDIEFKRDERSFTVDTLKELHSLYPDKRFAITIGADMLNTFERWKDYLTILNLADLIVFFRYGENRELFDNTVSKLKKIGANIHIVSDYIPEASSTFIRNQLYNGISVADYLPIDVYGYIVEKKLYGTNKHICQYINHIKNMLDDYRFNHSICVADEALRLAVKYHADPYKAYIAGLLHDTTKKFSEQEHLQFASKFGIMFSDIEKRSINLWHAITGSVYVNRVLGINDPEIIGAIRYHTTAKADMSLLEKIIYLADFTSADRNYPDVEIMRDIVDINIEKAMKYSLEYTVNDLNERGLIAHPDTLSALSEINSICFKGDNIES